MNPYRQYQPIAAVWVERAWDFGRNVKAHRANGGSANSVAVTGPWTPEQRIDEIFAIGKAGEVACATFFGLDPEKALGWTAERGPDAGHDLVLPVFGFDLLIDVKASEPNGNVIWPLTKNSFYWDANFQVMMGVSIDRHGDDLSQAWVEGFVTKREFFAHKRIADGVAWPRLTAGTWWLPKNCLHPLPRGALTLPQELMVQTLVEMLACQTKPVEPAPHVPSPPINSTAAIARDQVFEFVTDQKGRGP